MTVRPFPFGFIYSDSEDIAEFGNQFDWNQIMLPSHGQLWASRDQPVFTYFGEAYKAIWIGYSTFLTDTDTDGSNIARRAVESLESGGWEGFHRSLDLVVGRFVAFVWEGSSLRIYHDPVSIRPVYFNAPEGFISSHAPLLRELREYARKEIRDLANLGQYKLWEETEDPNVSALPPNFYLDVTEQRIRRYYPHSPISSPLISEEERVIKAAHLARKSMAYWNRLPLKLYSALTAGLDTRINAAAALGAGVDANFVTYGSGGEITNADNGSARSYKIDFQVTSRIAAALGLKHTLLATQDTPRFKLSREEKNILSRNTFGSHAIQFQGIYEEYLGAHPSLCFVGTAFEGMRDYYIPDSRPLSAYDEFKTTLSAIGGFKKGIRESDMTDEIAQEFWEKYDLAAAVEYGYPISNLVYLELRAGRFQSEAINCQATAFMPIHPLAIRSFFELGQAYYYIQRKNTDFEHAFIRTLYPAIAAFNINENPPHQAVPFVPEGITVRSSVLTDGILEVNDASQNRNDRLRLDATLLQKGSGKFFEKKFSLESGSLDIAISSNYYIGRPVKNIELFVAVNQKIIDSVPIGLRRTPYHFRVEGLQQSDLVRVGIRAKSNLGSAWVTYSTVNLLEWNESPDSSNSTLAVGSTANVEAVQIN